MPEELRKVSNPRPKGGASEYFLKKGEMLPQNAALLDAIVDLQPGYLLYLDKTSGIAGSTVRRSVQAANKIRKEQGKPVIYSMRPRDGSSNEVDGPYYIGDRPSGNLKDAGQFRISSLIWFKQRRLAGRVTHFVYSPPTSPDDDAGGET
jgi:hypothetical protein